MGSLIKKGYDVWPIYVRCGLPWEKAELYWARRILRKLGSETSRTHPLIILPLSLDKAYRSNWSQTGRTPGARSLDEAVFMPARNLLLITKAFLALTAQNISTLAIGTLAKNPFPDGRLSYFKHLSTLLSLSFRRPLKIIAPLRKKRKKDLLTPDLRPYLPLSFSCINPHGLKHCERCNKCAERKRALHRE